MILTSEMGAAFSDSASGSPARSRRSRALACLRSNARLGLAGSGWNAGVLPPVVVARVRAVGPRGGAVCRVLAAYASDGKIPFCGPEALRRRALLCTAPSPRQEASQGS
jgi:hypothetical protein